MSVLWNNFMAVLGGIACQELNSFKINEASGKIGHPC